MARVAVGEVRAVTGTGTARLVLPATPDSTGRARRHVRETLRGRVDDSVLDAVELCASELVTNAVLHARTDLRVEVTLGNDGIRLAVHDRSPLPPRLVPHSRTAATGRGLAMIAAVAADWGLDPDPSGGKAVWCRLPLHSPEAGEDGLYGRWDDDLAELLTEPTPAADPSPAVPADRPGTTQASAAPSSTAAPAVITLLGYPVRAGMRLREHQEEVLRECRLLQLPGSHGHDHVTARLVRLAGLLAAEFEAGLSDPARHLVEALLSGQDRVDLTYQVGPDTRAVVEAWQGALAELDRFSQEHNLLTLATPPDLARLANWGLHEFLRQLDGQPPRPWPHPQN